jgi:hypothetical protein
MADLLLSLAILFVFGWVARALRGARELTWRRTLLATFIGFIFGQTVAVLLLVGDVSQTPEATRPELSRVASNRVMANSIRVRR